MTNMNMNKNTNTMPGVGVPSGPTPVGRETIGVTENFSAKKAWQHAVAEVEEKQLWVDQLSFVITWLRELLWRVESTEGKSSRWARLGLDEVMWLAMLELMRMASGDGGGEGVGAECVSCG